MNKTLLSIGHGYSAQALARALIPLGWRIIGTSRGETATQQVGVEHIVWPSTDLTPYLAQATHVLSSVAPNAQGDPVLAEYSEAIQLGNFKWVGYLSTTGVYGDRNGGWVSEADDLLPTTQRGKWRVKAEAEWGALSIPLHIFRLAGIYGPGRGPFAKVRAGTARRIIKDNQVFSRIHVDDIAAALAASINRPNAGAVYNVCDDLAAPPQDVIGYAAELLGLPLPMIEDFQQAQMTPMARSFYAESKRVSNDRIKTELGVKLKYPDYRVGLQALLDAG